MGYGAGGGRPFKYLLRPGQDIDVGFVRMFISTRVVDLAGIEQRSPFRDDVGSRDAMGAQVKRRSRPKPIWDAVTIAVVQRRAEGLTGA